MSAQIKMLSISSVIIDELVSYDESDKSEMFDYYHLQQSDGN